MTAPNFFDTGSPFLAHPLLTAERTIQEINFLTSQLRLPAGSHWLDVGCGFGRHAIELARRNFIVTGIDPAAAMIDAARSKAKQASLDTPPTFLQQHAESFTSAQRFSAAICLFTSLGQISDQGENSGLIQAVYDVLEPEGYFVVEAPQRTTTVAQLRPNDKFGVGERYTAVTRQYNMHDQTVTEQFELVAPEGNRAYTLQYRLFSAEELRDLMTTAGFTIVGQYADFQGAPFQPSDPFMLMVGQKR